MGKPRDHARERSRRELLLQYADKGFRPPDEWNKDRLARAEAVRLRRITLQGAVAMSTPRRLADASSTDLAGDRFLSKGVANTYWTLWNRLVISKHAPLPAEELGPDEQHLHPPEWDDLSVLARGDEEAWRLGRTVEWEAWWEDLRPRLLARRRALATFAMRDGCTAWGYRVVDNIGSEVKWIEGKFDTWRKRYIYVEDWREDAAL